MAVMMSRFCRLWLLEKDEFCSTIFSSSSMSSACRLAVMKLFTATLTCSGFLLSGRAVDTTCSSGDRFRRASAVSTILGYARGQAGLGGYRPSSVLLQPCNVIQESLWGTMKNCNTGSALEMVEDNLHETVLGFLLQLSNIRTIRRTPLSIVGKQMEQSYS